MLEIVVIKEVEASGKDVEIVMVRTGEGAWGMDSAVVVC